MRHVVIGTAGHIDHGKSALVRALTGTDPDRLKEEKARGITIDLGFAHYADGDTTFAFVDVPGHERFVKNMLAGASGVDAVMLVIAADEAVMPQTREHFAICALLRLAGGLVVLTKSDLVDAETLELARLEACELVAGSFLERRPIVAVSAKTGAGLDELRRALRDVTAGMRARRASGAARLPIDRAFSVKGFGTVVTGTLVSGRIGVDSDLELLPGPRPVKVRGIQVHGRTEREAVAGQRAAVNLAGVETAALTRGQTLASPASFEDTRRFDVTIELVPAARPLRHGARVRFHQGTSEIIGRVALAGIVGETPEISLGELGGGRHAFARLHLEQPAVLTRGDRFILRAYSPIATVAGGVVLDPRPPRGRLRTRAGRERLQRLLGASDVPPALDARSAVAAMVGERGAVGLPIRQVTSRAGVPPDQVDHLVAELSTAGQAMLAGDVLIAPAEIRGLADRLVAEVETYHATHPLHEGLPREEARHRIFRHAHPAVFERVLANLGAAGRLIARDHLTLTSHQVALSTEEERARLLVERAFRADGLKPRDLSDLIASERLSPGVVERVIGLLIRQKVLVRLDTLVFHREALAALKDEMRSLRHAAAPPVKIDVGTFKAQYGVSRKYAIPLLEYLDRERVTRRVGDARILL